ncbi:MAG: hypothetical protein KKF44_09355, partial [Nanoarchaeota archaeon]|nr:hypothetical protein [Nanoarchaeota archaeon]
QKSMHLFGRKDCLFTVLFIPKTKQSLRVINLEGFHTLYTTRKSGEFGIMKNGISLLLISLEH